MSNMLTAEHKKNQLSELAKHNIMQADITPEINTSTSSNGIVLSSNVNESHHAPSGWIMASSIKDLKNKLGVKDDDIDTGIKSDHHINYPPEPSPNLLQLHKNSPDGCSFEQSLCDNHKQDAHHLANATLAYVMGHSKKVSKYEDAINKVSFPKPMTIPVFAAENVTVSPGKPLVLKSDDNKPIVVSFGSVTVEQGGEIQIIGGSTQWTSQTFIQK
jgi:hypothetical protein